MVKFDENFDDPVGDERKRPGEYSSKARAWLFYDMGSSAYALSIGTLYFPLFFNEFASGGSATSSHFALAVLLSTVMVGIAAPLLGAFADQRLKRNWLFIFTGTASVVGTAMLSLVSDLPIPAVVVAYALVNTTFLLATNLYDSYLSLFGASDRNYARRSGLGWALGYLGGLICLGVTLTVLGFRVPSSLNDYRIVFLIAAIMYGGFSLYVFLKLPVERELPRLTRGTIGTVIDTLRNWRKHRLFFVYLAGSILIVDGMTTVLYFMSIYASEQLHFSVGQITLVFAIVQGVAIPGTWLISMSAKFMREAHVIVLTCLGWVVLATLFALGPSFTGLLWIAALGGLVVGTTPALLRAVLGQLVPVEDRAQLFGFAAMGSRVGAILGPLIYLFALRTAGLTVAMFSSVPALLIGALIFFSLSSKLPTERNSTTS